MPTSSCCCISTAAFFLADDRSAAVIGQRAEPTANHGVVQDQLTAPWGGALGHDRGQDAGEIPRHSFTAGRLTRSTVREANQLLDNANSVPRQSGSQNWSKHHSASVASSSNLDRRDHETVRSRATVPARAVGKVPDHYIKALEVIDQHHASILNQRPGTARLTDQRPSRSQTKSQFGATDQGTYQTTVSCHRPAAVRSVRSGAGAARGPVSPACHRAGGPTQGAGRPAVGAAVTRRLTLPPPALPTVDEQQGQRPSIAAGPTAGTPATSSHKHITTQHNTYLHTRCFGGRHRQMKLYF